MGENVERKRRVGWGEPYDVRTKKSRDFANLMNNEKNITERGSVVTSKERSEEQSLGWDKKLNGPRMGMVADRVEKRVSAKHRLHGNEQREIIKRKVENPTIEIKVHNSIIERSQKMEKSFKDDGRNVLMTEIVEEEDGEEFDNIVGIIKTSGIDEVKTVSRFAGRLGPSFAEEEWPNIDNKIKKMEEKIQKRRRANDDLEHDDGTDLPAWDETVVIKVPKNELDIEREKRRRQVIEELQLIEAAKQREEIRLKKEIRIEELKKRERIVEGIRRKEDLRIKQEEELRRQEELIQNQMQMIERQKEMEIQKHDLEMMRQRDEKEITLKKIIENEKRVKEEIKIIKEKERRLMKEKKYKECKKAEQLSNEKRKEVKGSNYLNINSKETERENKSRRRDFSDEDSSSESEESDSDSSSSSSSESDSYDSDSEDSEYDRKRRKTKSKDSVRISATKKESLNEKERHANKGKQNIQTREIKSNKTNPKTINSSKNKEEQHSKTSKENQREERKPTNDETKKTAELKDKLKSYLNRAKSKERSKK